jgi:hypothetical protein
MFLLSLPVYFALQAAKKSVFKILDRISSINPFNEEGLKPSTITGRIEFVNVSFRYFRPAVAPLSSLCHLSVRVPSLPLHCRLPSAVL